MGNTFPFSSGSEVKRSSPASHPFWTLLTLTIALTLSGTPPVQATEEENLAPHVVYVSGGSGNAPAGVLVSVIINSDSEYHYGGLFSDPGDTLTVVSISHNQSDDIVEEFETMKNRSFIQIHNREDLCAVEGVLFPLDTVVSITVRDTAGNEASTTMTWTTQDPCGED